MLLKDFMQLPQPKQADILYEDGVFLGKEKHGGYTRVLFQLAGFYVAVSYVRYRQTIASIQCFEHTEPIEKYLEVINIEELIGTL